LPTASVVLAARQKLFAAQISHGGASSDYHDPALNYFFALFAAFSAFAAARPRGRTMSATLFGGA